MIEDSTKMVIAQIDADFVKIQDALLNEFGNEGADIGDASCAYELIGNTQGVRHDSYTPYRIVRSIAKLIDLSPVKVNAAFKNVMNQDKSFWDGIYGFEG